MPDHPVTASRYARWRATALGAAVEQVEVRVVLDLAGPLRSKRVLDVGTGDGTYAIEAAAAGGIVAAVDASLEMLTAARARAALRGADVAFLRGRAEEQPFGDASVDVVFAVTVLCLVPDAALAVREMERVLAPGGRLVLGELSRASIWAIERRARGWLGAVPWRGARFWSRSDLEHLLEDAGLRVTATRSAVFFPPIDVAARFMAPLDPLLGRLRAPGGAFIALAADKPSSGPLSAPRAAGSRRGKRGSP